MFRVPLIFARLGPFRAHAYLPLLPVTLLHTVLDGVDESEGATQFGSLIAIWV